MTGFRTYSEFVEETDPYERLLTIKSIEQWHDDQAPRGRGGMGGGGQPGL